MKNLIQQTQQLINKGNNEDLITSLHLDEKTKNINTMDEGIEYLKEQYGDSILEDNTELEDADEIDKNQK